MNPRVTSYQSTRLTPNRAIRVRGSLWSVSIFSTLIVVLASTSLVQWRWISKYRQQVSNLQSEITSEQHERRIAQKELNSCKLERNATRDSYKARASHHLTRLLEFAEFVKDDPRLAKRVLIEASEFARKQSIDQAIVAERLKALPTLKQLATDCSAKLIDVSNDTNTAQILVEVTSADGSFVHDLSRVDFEIQSQGRTLHPVRVSEESTARGEHWISILLDSSSSISPNEFASVQKATKELVRNIANPWRVRVVRFATDVKPVSPWTYDPQIHELAIDRVKVDGATALNEAIRSEVSELLALVGMRSIVILTDGNDSSNHINLEPVFQRCRTEGIRIHVVALNKGTINEVVLRSMASQTKGSYQSIASIDRLQTTFGNIARSLRTPVYRVTALTPIDMHSLRVNVAGITASQTSNYVTARQSAH
jgi:von Willebrand factor type A domain